MKCKCCNKKIKKQEFYLSDEGIIVCFICYVKTSKIMLDNIIYRTINDRKNRKDKKCT